jgi:uncharacterized protein YbaA (DUF1428 family)
MICLLLLSIGLHGVVFTWAMCRAAHNSDAAMESALNDARARDRV